MFYEILTFSFVIVIISIVIIFLFFEKRMKKTEKKIEESTKAFLFDLTENNNKSFFELAKNTFERYQEGNQKDIEHKHKELEAMLIPLKESLEKVHQHNHLIEEKRKGAYASLEKQIESLIQSENFLRTETTNLSRALHSPVIRGSWGQIHLKRVVELAGMLNHCDFFEQKTQTEEEKMYRPDLVVHLPGKRHIVIDAKTPIESYLEASSSKKEEERNHKLRKHALSVKKHIKDLSKKQYWKVFSSSPEYVILFLPAEALFSAALEIEPTLLEIGAELNVILATPTTLIAILRAIAHSWRQESLSKSAQEIAQIGKDLYERIMNMHAHWIKLGQAISHSVDAYNHAVASLESRVLVSARKLKQLGVGAKENPIPALKEVHKITRSLEKIEESAEV